MLPCITICKNQKENGKTVPAFVIQGVSRLMTSDAFLVSFFVLRHVLVLPVPDKIFHDRGLQRNMKAGAR